nr:hypothetical protein [Tanacetum cinerariifolium]
MESTIPLNDINSQEPSSNVITTSSLVLPIEDPEDSLIIGNEDLNTIPEKNSDEFKKSSVEDLIPILSESEDTSGSESVCILPSSDDFSPIDIPEEKADVLKDTVKIYSNPLFNSNDDFTSSDDESLANEDVPEDNIKIYSNPLFEFNDEYISSDVNPFFDEVLEDIECKDSYDSSLDESTFLVTRLSDSNEDEYFTLGDDVELLLHRDPSTPIMSVVSILEGPNNEPPLEQNDDLFDLKSKNDEWKKILYDAPIDDLMTEDKVFDPGIHDQNFSPTYLSLPFEDRHYLFFTYVVRIFHPHIIYPVVSLFLISSGSEDTIFDPGISAFYFSHRSGTFTSFNVYPNILNESPMENFPSTCFTPNITMIWDIPYEEIKVHIKVLSVLWDNRLLIPDGSLPLSRVKTPDLLVTPLFDVNEDDCFDSGGDVDKINDFEDSYYDSEGDIFYLESLLNDDLVHHDTFIHAMSVVSILEGFIDEPPLEENDDLFDLEPKNDDWKKILYDVLILMTEDKVFDPEIYDQIFSSTYVSLPFMDRHYLFFTYVVRIYLPHFIYPVVSPFLISFESEDTIFDLGAFHFSHRSGTFICFNINPNILNESPIKNVSSTRFYPNITMIWGESS